MKRLLFACAAVALLGCGGSDSTGPVASAEGTWNLQTVGGVSLPFTYQTSPTRLEVLSDQFVIEGTGSFTETFVTRETDGTQVTETPESDTGTWTQSGNQVALTFSDNSNLVVIINGDHISVNSQVGVLVYERQ